MKNSDVGASKTTKVEKLMNKFILIVLAIQIICVMITGIGQVIECQYPDNVQDDTVNCVEEFFLTLARYFLLFNTFLPISLIVSLEFIKVG